MKETLALPLKEPLARLEIRDPHVTQVKQLFLGLDPSYNPAKHVEPDFFRAPSFKGALA